MRVMPSSVIRRMGFYFESTRLILSAEFELHYIENLLQARLILYQTYHTYQPIAFIRARVLLRSGFNLKKGSQTKAPQIIHKVYKEFINTSDKSL